MILSDLFISFFFVGTHTFVTGSKYLNRAGLSSLYYFDIFNTLLWTGLSCNAFQFIINLASQIKEVNR